MAIAQGVAELALAAAAAAVGHMARWRGGCRRTPGALTCIVRPSCTTIAHGCWSLVCVTVMVDARVRRG